MKAKSGSDEDALDLPPLLPIEFLPRTRGASDSGAPTPAVLEARAKFARGEWPPSDVSEQVLAPSYVGRAHGVRPTDDLTPEQRRKFAALERKLKREFEERQQS